MALPITLHLLAAIIWVGGMFFMHSFLRPSAEPLDLTTRVTLWAGVLSRFIPWVWASVLVLPGSGYWILLVEWGGFAAARPHVIIMQILGWIMILLFIFMYFRYFLRMRWMFSQLLIPEAGLYILKIRRIATINLMLGMLVVMVASAGRYM